MRNLRKLQINLVCRRMNTGRLSVYRIGKLAGVKGKLEKLNDTIKRFYRYFGGDIDKAVTAYNEKKLHMSLEWYTPREV